VVETLVRKAAQHSKRCQQICRPTRYVYCSYLTLMRRWGIFHSNKGNPFNRNSYQSRTERT